MSEFLKIRWTKGLCGWKYAGMMRGAFHEKCKVKRETEEYQLHLGLWPDKTKLKTEDRYKKWLNNVTILWWKKGQINLKKD